MKFKFKLFIFLTILIFSLSACGGGTSGGFEPGEKIEVSFNDKVVMYNGEMYQLEIEGKIPEGIMVYYEYFLDGQPVSDNGVIEPGEYEVRVYFEGDIDRYGLPKELIAHLIIKDGGNVNPGEVYFDEQTFDYDGKMHSIYVSGYLPSEVKVHYEYLLHGEFISNEGVVEPGDYEVIAKFEGPFDKYGLPDHLFSMIHIVGGTDVIVNVSYEDAIFCIDDVGYIYHEITGSLPGDISVHYENNNPTEPGVYTARVYFDGDLGRYGLPEFLESTIEVYETIKFNDSFTYYDGSYHNLELDCYLPKDVFVEYEYMRSDGLEGSNDPVEPGTYFVTARLSGNLGKYGFDDKYHATLTIFDPNRVSFDSQTFEYVEGMTYSIYMNNLPGDVGVYYEYINANTGDFVSEFGVEEPGLYEVRAILTGEYMKYGLSEQYSAIMEVMPKVEPIEVTFVDKTVTYDGNEHSIVIDQELPSDVYYTYYNNSGTNAGRYDAYVVFEGNYYMYGIPERMFATLTIEKMKIDTSDIKFEDGRFDYDPNVNHSIYINTQYIDYLDVVYSNNNQNLPGTYQVHAVVFAKDYSNVELVGNNEFYASLTVNHIVIDVNVEDLMFGNDVVEYDGFAHYMYLYEEYLPEGVFFDTYVDNGNVDAGRYEVKFILYIGEEYRNVFSFANGSYFTEIIKTQIITKKAFEVKFVQTTFTYDGSVKTLEVNRSDLPVDVNVTFGYNMLVDAGEYLVDVYVNPLGESQNYEFVREFQQKVIINKAEYPSDVYMENINVSYDGCYYMPLVKNLPSDTNVTYNRDEVCDAGYYEFTATLQNRNYNDITLRATVLIHAIEFDYRYIKYEQTTFTYDGLPHNLVISNPEIMPDCYTYYCSETDMVDANTYYVRVYFESTNQNYASFYLDQTVTINKLVVDMSDVVLEDMIYTYDGTPKEYVYNGELPFGISNIFYTNNYQIEAGQYDVTIDFSTLNDNIEDIPSKTAKLIINKAKLDMSGVSFNDLEVEYDGNNKSIYIDGYVDTSIINVTYLNNDHVEVGEYVVTVTFSHDLANYEQIESMSATLKILPKEMELEFLDQEFTYDETRHYLEVSNIPEGVSVTYTNNGKIDAGEYTVIANISYDKTGNYRYPDQLEAKLIINKAPLPVTYDHRVYTYTGKEITHNVQFSSIPSGFTFEYTNNKQSRPGVYECSVLITGQHQNYEAPGLLTSTFEIVKEHYFDITLVYEDRIEYIYGILKNSYIANYLPAVPEKDQYIGYWEGAEGYLTGDITVYAKYNPIYHTIYIDTDGAYLNISTVEAAYNHEFTLPELTREGYTFAGYYYNGELFESGLYPYKESIEIKAKWIPDTYKIIIKDKSGNTLTEIDTYQGEFYRLPLAITVGEDTIYAFSYRANGKTYLPNIPYYFDFDSDLELTINEFDMILNDQFTFEFTYENSNELIIKSYTGEDLSLTIPEYGYYQGKFYPITEIGKNAINSDTLETLYVGTHITRINYGAFSGLTNIVDLTVPRVDKMADFFSTASFSDNYRDVPTTLEKVTILPSEEGCSIFNGTFEGTSVKEVVLPEGITTIGYSAFASCKNLVKVNIPSTVTSIGVRAFINCSSLTSITLPNSITEIKDETFAGTGLTGIVIPSSVEKIGNAVFEGCDYLTQINIPDSVTSIGKDCFYSCDALTNVNISSNSQLSSIGSYAFYYCILLKSIYIPTGVTEILDNTFNCCLELETVTLNSNVKTVGNYAFHECKKLVNISLANLEYIGDYAFRYAAINNVTLSNKLQYLGAYALSYTNITSVTIPSSITTIEIDTFSWCSSLTTVKLPETIEVVKERAFYYCSNLTTINFPYSLKEIGNYSFSGIGITSVTLPAGITKIPTDAFYNCSALENVQFLGNLESIGDYAFSGCNKLTSINIPQTVTEIGEGAFKDTYKLTTITLPKSITKISDWAFYGSGITSLDFSNITYVGDNAFYNSYLTKVNFSNKLEYIGEHAFYYNDLTEVNIPSSVKFIGDRAFTENKLTTLTIPYVGNTLFNNDKATITDIYQIDNLENLTINGGIVYSDSLALLTSLKNLTISEDIYFVESGFADELKSLTYNEYGNGRYIGNSENKYLVFAGAIDSATTVTLHSNTRFGDNVYDSILYLENNVYYLPYAGDKYYMAVGIADKNATEIILNDNTKYLGEKLFYECANLKNVVLADSLLEIEKNIFIYNYKLEQITIPYLASDPTLSELYLIKDIINSRNTRPGATLSTLKKVVIKRGVIGEYAFSTIKQSGIAIDEVILGQEVSEICDYAFAASEYSGLVFKLTIEEGSTLKTIGDYAFEKTGVYDIDFPTTLKTIGDYAFRECYNISNVMIPASVEEIGEGIYKGVYKIKGIVFESGSKITEIPDYAFAGHNMMTNEDALVSVVLPENLTSIGDFAFADHGNLASITLPQTLTTLGVSAFEDSLKLVDINLEDTAITEIKHSTFYHCMNLVTITIPNTVKFIDELAFGACYSLESCYFEEGSQLETVGPAAFMNSDELSTIKLPEGLKTIQDGAFMGCSKLKEITLPSTLENLGILAFGHLEFERIEIPSSMTTFNIGAFNGNIDTLVINDCTTLIKEEFSFDVYGRYLQIEKLYIHADLENADLLFKYLSTNYSYNEVYFKGTVEEWLAFEISDDIYCQHFYLLDEDGNVYNPTEVVVPEGITKIGKYKFANSLEITKVVLSSSVKEIAQGAFYNCPKLETIEWAGELDRIGKEAFGYCTAITTLNLPKVRVIGEGAFTHCSNLTELTFTEGTLEILDKAFYFIGDIDSIILPEGIKEIHKFAFDTNGNIKEFYIPSTVEVIEAYGIKYFKDYSNTHVIYYNGTVSDWLLIDMGSNNGFGGTMHFKDENDEYYELIDLVIPEGVTEIPEYQFYSIDFTNLYLPSTIQIIGNESIATSKDVYFNGTFEEFMNIKCYTEYLVRWDYAIFVLDEEGNQYQLGKDLIIPETITEITDLPFTYYYEGFNTITIHKDVTLIDTNHMPSSIKKIYYEGTLRDWFNIDIINSNSYDGGSYYNADFYLLDENGDYQLVKAINVPDEVTVIGDHQFDGLKSIEKIYMHEGVTHIGFYSFDSTNVEIIELGKSVEEVNCIGHVPYLIIQNNNLYIQTIYSDVYYLGTYEERMANLRFGSQSSNKKFYYYSETEPTDTTYSYWHYDLNGKPVIW